MSPQGAVLGRGGSMRTSPLGLSVELHPGATKLCTGWGGHMRTSPRGPSVELPMGPGSVALVRRTRANVAIWSFGGASYAATKLCTGWGGRTRISPVGPSVDDPVVPRSV
eukprot:938302-Pyramimonas_sp.AAC.1